MAGDKVTRHWHEMGDWSRGKFILLKDQHFIPEHTTHITIYAIETINVTFSVRNLVFIEKGGFVMSAGRTTICICNLATAVGYLGRPPSILSNVPLKLVQSEGTRVVLVQKVTSNASKFTLRNIAALAYSRVYHNYKLAKEHLPHSIAYTQNSEHVAPTTAINKIHVRHQNDTTTVKYSDTHFCKGH